ncbi:MAG TPA: HEAT repeat domain-containing protein, partial [Planctomycetaceae bacterium]|nr:HEAT repeat domain-containing protein [Planctomycetaceae bacterium]
MSDPLSRTFDLLASAKSLAAVDLLLAALDSKRSAIQDLAVAALLRRAATRCQTEVIRSLPELSPTARRHLEEQGPRLAGTLRQCLLHGDTQLRTNALTIVSTMECYDQVGTLLTILEQRDDPFQEPACHTFVDLVNRLYEQIHLTNGRKPSDRPRNLPQARQGVLTALEAACNRFADLAYPREVVESILILGDPDSNAVRKAFLQSTPACREMAGTLVMTSKHPGVMRLLMEFMGQNYPNPKAFEAFENRIDAEFVCHVLRSFPKRLTENQQKNFKQLSRVAWISDELLPLEAIPSGLHESLSGFIQAIGINLDDKIEIQKWILLNGSMPGRQAATQILESISPESVRGILFGSLDSENEDVQVWATSQLRSQGVPEAIRLLIERLDSPLPAVREAAREELGSFDLSMVLNLFEHLDRNLCSRVGALMRKIDPKCAQKLVEELNQPIRRRRIRAARAAEALGFAPDVEGGLLAMLSDADSIVRRVAAEL